jgi:hypothetical protein
LDGLPDRFADPRSVNVDAAEDGHWLKLSDDSWLWRALISAPGADHLNFGFGRFHLPQGARLLIVDPDGHTALSRPLSASDNKPHGQFWTPILQGDAALLEVWLPAGTRDQLGLTLNQVGVGYKGFGAGDDKSGSCNVDVVCSEADEWRAEIASVAVYGSQGSTWCTGFMVNNTAADETPLFQTANHCGLSTRSLVVYWNYESPSCGQHGGGRYDHWQSGATRLATDSRSDFDLVQLDDMPDPAWEVAFAGWDRSGDNASSAVAIHHPGTDEKSISFSDGDTATTSYYSNSSPGNGSHVRVKAWDEGTTESGSSGSPLFNQDHQVIGQLHGGYASCSNNSSDWYGAVEASWEGGGNSGSRLRDWLDPGNTGQLSVDTLAPWLGGLAVTPEEGWETGGDPGGPFENQSATWTLENSGNQSVDWALSWDVDWLDVSPETGTLSAGARREVDVSVASAADRLTSGLYTATLVFTELESGQEIHRNVRLQVGLPETLWSWTMDQDPGWQLEGDWEWGQPQGHPAPDGSPDPVEGHTGAAVLGYDLSGAYPHEMSPEHAMVGPLDLGDVSGVTLHFWRWLGVEGAPYDFAKVSISTDLETWNAVWDAGEPVDDGRWTESSLDLAAWADGESQVWLRWTMGESDRYVEHCGWNLDDVRIEGIRADQGLQDSGRYSVPEEDLVWDPPICGCTAARSGPGRTDLLWGLCVLLISHRRRRSSVCPKST